MTEFEYNSTTGSFSLLGKQVCRGYYGTQTEVINQFQFCGSRQNNWMITVANNGTTVRIFSISRDDYSTLIQRFRPWKETNDRVWFMSTFKHVDGHFRNWGTKNNTFGQMFEQIVGSKGVEQVMDMTSGSLCISYFIRHPDNDLYGEMRNAEPQVIQTIMWDCESSRYLRPNTLPPAHGVQLPMTIDPVDTTPEGPMITANITIENGFPLLVTEFKADGDIASTKLITEHDELLRRFRCRTHNRFAALFIAEQMVADTRLSVLELEQMKKEVAIARAELFSSDELNGWDATITAARDELNNDLSRKLNGAYVEFPSKIYQYCNVKVVIDSYQRNNCEENHAGLRRRIWQNLCECGSNPRAICAIEQFLQHYARMTIV